MTPTPTKQTPGTIAAQPVARSAATVSFVVPTRDSARTLGNCLRSIRAQTHPHLELIVVDNASTDATVSIARDHADTVLQVGPERSAQRNAGWRAAYGGIVAFIDSDMVLEPEVAAESVHCFARAPEAGALVIPERAFGEGYLARCRALEKRLYLGDPSVEAARVFRWEAVELAGGYDETLYAAEDWEFADRVRALGWGLGRLEAGVLHDEGRIRLAALFRKKCYYGRNLRRYLLSPQIASRPVPRGALLARPGELLRSPLLTTGLVLLKSVEAAGLLCGAATAKQVGDR
jgi:glycosyltransferase involved in cell wall biosynthesis